MPIKNPGSRSLLTCFLFVVVLLLAAGICRGRGPQKLRAAVSILPQVYFVERIGADRVQGEALVSPGRSPATYAPTPAQISKLAKSDVYFRIGVPFENSLIPRIAGIAGGLPIVDTREGIRLRKMHAAYPDHGLTREDKGASGKTSDRDDDHAGRGVDPHTWLDPNLVKKQAATVCEALVALDPAGAGAYRSNLKRFEDDLEALDRRLARILKPFASRNLYVFHPSFGYLADAYGLRQVAIEIEGKSPKGRDLYAFIQLARQSNVRTIFVQPQFDRQAAKKIAAALQGRVIPLDPLAENYLQNMEEMALKIVAALQEG